MDPPILPHRTHQTSLTNDELLLYDAVFNLKGLYLGGFFRHSYGQLFNTPYTHSLDDALVWATLERHVALGVMSRGDGCDGYPSFSLTAQGGHLWELEREPVWQRYCQAAYTSMDEDEFYVQSPCAETVAAFFETAVQCNYYPGGYAKPVAPKKVEAPDEPLIWWREFHEVYEIRVPAVPGGDWVDWRLYEVRRTWWRTISELQSFVRGTPT